MSDTELRQFVDTPVDDVRDATLIRTCVEDNAITSVCFVCCSFVSRLDISWLRLDGGVPNLHMLRKDGLGCEGCVDAPRHGHTVFTHRGIEDCLLDTVAEGTNGKRSGYISLRAHVVDPQDQMELFGELRGPGQPNVHPKGQRTVRIAANPTDSEDKEVSVCGKCKAALSKKRLPPFSLPRIDPGLLPPELEPLSPLEWGMVSFCRGKRRTITCYPAGSKTWRSTGTAFKRLESNVVAFESAIPFEIQRRFPLRMEDLPELITVVFVTSARTIEEVSGFLVAMCVVFALKESRVV